MGHNKYRPLIDRRIKTQEPQERGIKTTKQVIRELKNHPEKWRLFQEVQHLVGTMSTISRQKQAHTYKPRPEHANMIGRVRDCLRRAVVAGLGELHEIKMNCERYAVASKAPTA